MGEAELCMAQVPHQKPFPSQRMSSILLSSEGDRGEFDVWDNAAAFQLC